MIFEDRDNPLFLEFMEPYEMVRKGEAIELEPIRTCWADLQALRSTALLQLGAFTATTQKLPQPMKEHTSSKFNTWQNAVRWLWKEENPVTWGESRAHQKANFALLCFCFLQ